MAPPPDVVAHPGLAAAERLRRIAVASEAGEPLDVGDAGWLAAGLNLYLGGAAAGLKLDEALEVAVPPGASPWWSARLRAERDDAIRRLGDTFPGPATSRALAVAEALRRYGPTGWRHDRARGAPITSDARRKLLYAVFKVEAFQRKAFPTAARKPVVGASRLTAPAGGEGAAVSAAAASPSPPLEGEAGRG